MSKLRRLSIRQEDRNAFEVRWQSNIVRACRSTWHPSAPVLAEEDEDAKQNAAQLTVYGWLPGFGGELQTAPGGPTLSVSKSFGELLEDLDSGFMANGLVRRDRFVLTADVIHSSSSKEGLLSTGLPSPLPTAVRLQGRLRQTSLTALAGYRVADGEHATLDLLGGARAWWLNARVTVPRLNLTGKAEGKFVDPIVAARANFKLNKRLSVLGYADVGGFGAGSDLTFQAAATVNARVGKRFWISGGYRYLAVDYSEGGVRLDSRLGGPVVGVTYAF